jgi:hypothetical protein
LPTGPGHYFSGTAIADDQINKSLLTLLLKYTIMSKDKGSKNVKKAPATQGKKAPSDYQSGKKTVSKDDISINKKK